MPRTRFECKACGASAFSRLCGVCRSFRKQAALKALKLHGRGNDPKAYTLLKKPLVLKYRRLADAGRPLFPEAKGA